MKKIILIGASGFVGSAILQEALERGYAVEAVVRDANKITVKNPNLTIKQADVSSSKVVAEICQDANTVISAYNPGWTNPNIYEDTMKIYPAILQGAKEAGVKRLLIVGGASTLFVEPGVRMIDKVVFPKEILPGIKGLADFYLNVLMKEKQLDWVFFSSAANFTDGERTGKFRLGKDDLIVDEKGDSNISVKDYAIAMIDELEKPQHHYERFTIGY